MAASVERARIAREIAQLSALEIASAVGIFRRSVAIVARWPSLRLGELLARFDERISEVGVSAAAREVIGRLGAKLEHRGACPADGGGLVVANHPGAYDALSVVAALGRDDVALIAADRPFLRAMPRLRQHLIFVADPADHGTRDVAGRARGLRQAFARLDGGGVVVQFGAGAIEPDARFARHGDAVLGEWGAGTGLLAQHASRRGAWVIPCFVSGVHSPRAKRLRIVRWAERRGVTTIAPLVQATLPGFRDVTVRIRLGDAVPTERLRTAEHAGARTAVVREAVARLVRC